MEQVNITEYKFNCDLFSLNCLFLNRIAESSVPVNNIRYMCKILTKISQYKCSAKKYHIVAYLIF